MSNRLSTGRFFFHWCYNRYQRWPIYWKISLGQLLKNIEPCGLKKLEQQHILQVPQQLWKGTYLANALLCEQN